jgi:hypothetical protein
VNLFEPVESLANASNWSCFVLKNLVGRIVIFHFGLKMYFDIELGKCITTLERFDFHKEELSDL